MNIDDIVDLIHEHEKDDKPNDGYAVYIPQYEWKDIENELDRYTRTSTDGYESYAGYALAPDPYIQKAQVLPLDVSDIRGEDYILSEPPKHLLEQLISVDETPYTDPIRDVAGISFRQRLFLHPFCIWQRFNDNMVSEYGDPISTANLDVIQGPNHEYTKTDIQESHKQKFGRDFVTTRDGMAVPHDDVVDWFCRVIHRTLRQVNSSPIKAERTRVIKGPYPVLDIEHTEELYFGQRHTTYEGVVMVPPDSLPNAKRVDAP